MLQCKLLRSRKVDMTEISFKGRHTEKPMILQCVRWYLAYALSYRNLEEMMKERGFAVDHSTIHRWVLHYSPLLEQAFHRKKRRPGGRGFRWKNRGG